MTHANANSNELNNPTFLDCASLESSAPLEASTPLDYRDETKTVAQASSTVQAPSSTFNTANFNAAPRYEQQVQQDNIKQPASAVSELTGGHTVDRQSLAYQQERLLPMPTVVAEERVQLLEERLVVDHKKRKVGEVIVRKVIETHIVEVPVRREKLLIEQVGSEHKQLALIDLGQPTTDAVELAQSSDLRSQLAVCGEFTSIRAASQFLATIASSQLNPDHQNIQVTIMVDNVEQQQLYQQWLNRYLDSQQLTKPAT